MYLSGLLPQSLKNVTYYDVAKRYIYFNQKEFEKVQFTGNTTGKYLVTGTTQKRKFWYKTLMTLRESEISVIGKTQHQKLIKYAKEFLYLEKKGVLKH